MRTIQGVEDLGLFRVIGQPNLNFTVDRDSGRALPDQRRRRAGRDSDRGGRQRAHPGSAGRTALRPGGALSAAVPRHQGSHREYPAAGAHRASAFRWRSSATCKVEDGASEIYREGNSALRRHQVRRARARPGQHGGRGHREGERSRSSCRPATTSIGPANTPASSARSGG